MRITSFLKLYVIAFSLLLWGYNSESKAQALPQSKSSVIIGENDGPTAIYIGEQPDFLLREGLDMVRNMCTLANDANYIKYSTNNPDIIRLIKDIGSGNYQTNYHVFEIDHLQGFLKPIMDLKANLGKAVYERFYKSISMQINSSVGSTIVAATSLLVWDDVSHYDKLERPCLYLYCFENDINCMVLFFPKKEYIVQTYGTFIVHHRFSDLKTSDDVKAALKEVLHVSDINIKVIQ